MAGVLTIAAPSEIREHRTILSVRRHFSGGCFVAFRYALTPTTGAFEVDGVADLPAVDACWLRAVQLGAAEQEAYWAAEGSQLVGMRLTVLGFKFHAVDINRAICEEAGRRVVDKVVEWLSTQAEPGAAPNGGCR